MLITDNKRYMKRYVIGGSGIFDSLGSLFKNVATSARAAATSPTARSISSKLASTARTEVGRAAKEAAKEIALKSIDVGKDIAIAKAKSLIKPKSRKMLKSMTDSIPAAITDKSKVLLSSLLNQPPTDINNLLVGSGVTIQDFVKRMNGGGLKIS